MGWHTVDHHGDGRVSLTLKAVRGENAELVASDPTKFFMPPYMAHHGYVGIYLDADEVDWEGRVQPVCAIPRMVNDVC